MKKFLSTLATGLLGISSVFAQLNELQNLSSVPTGYTANRFLSTTTTPCEGTGALRVNLYGSTYTSGNLITKTLTGASAIVPTTVSFQWKLIPYGTTGTVSLQSVKVQYSKDNGTTYVDLPAIPAQNATTACATYTQVIPAGTFTATDNIKFKFEATLNNTLSDFYVYLDDLKITQPQTSAPSCTTITSPTPGATNVALKPTINWNAISIASGYKLSVGTTDGGTEILNNFDLAVNSYTLTNNLNNGTTYYIKVIPYNSVGQATGCTTSSFTTGLPPANDNIDSATPLTPSTTATCITQTAGTVALATGNTIPNTCLGSPDDDVWYSFVASSPSHVITLSSVSGSATDMTISVFSGTTAAPVMIACSDPNQVNVGGLTVGQTYYVRVYTTTSTEAQTTIFNICITTPPTPPANDTCSGAYVANSFPYNYVQTDTANATSNPPQNICANNGQNDGLWFSFTGNGGQITVAISGVQAGFDPQLGVYSGTCGTLACVGTVDNGYAGGGETYTLSSTLGTTYYVNVSDYMTNSTPLGNFSIGITTTLATSEVDSLNKSIKVYPNPAQEEINISAEIGVKDVQIIDMTGKLVSTNILNNNKLNLTNLSKGNYILKIKLENGTEVSKKLIKK